MYLVRLGGDGVRDLMQRTEMITPGCCILSLGCSENSEIESVASGQLRADMYEWAPCLRFTGSTQVARRAVL